jgi:hypothetical protein
MGEIRNVNYEPILVRKSLEKRPLSSLRGRWKYSIKILNRKWKYEINSAGSQRSLETDFAATNQKENVIVHPNSVASVRKQTTSTKRPSFVGEVSVDVCGQRVSRGQRNGSLRPYSGFSRQEVLLYFIKLVPQLYSRGWVIPFYFPKTLRIIAITKRWNVPRPIPSYNTPFFAISPLVKGSCDMNGW